MSETPKKSRQTLRRAEKLLWAALPVLGVVLLFTAGCSSRGTSTAGDVTGSVVAEPPTLGPPPYAQPVAAAPAVAPPPRLASCRPTYYRSNDATGSIPGRDAFDERPRLRRLVPAVGMVIHVIEPNETLYSIARSHHTTVGEIARINEIDPNATIRVGYVLIVPRA